MWVYGVIGGSNGPYRPAGFGPPALTIVNPITHNLTPQTNDDDVHTHTHKIQVVREVNGYKECDVKRYVRVEKVRLLVR